MIYSTLNNFSVISDLNSVNIVYLKQKVVFVSDNKSITGYILAPNYQGRVILTVTYRT